MIEITFKAETLEEVLCQLRGLLPMPTPMPTFAPGAPVTVHIEPPATTRIESPVFTAPPVVPAPPAPPVPPVVAAPTYTHEQVGKAGADLVAANPGLMPTLLNLLQKYGVQLVTDLKPEQLGTFAGELRALGAKI